MAVATTSNLMGNIRKQYVDEYLKRRELNLIGDTIEFPGPAPLQNWVAESEMRWHERSRRSCQWCTTPFLEVVASCPQCGGPDESNVDIAAEQMRMQMVAQRQAAARPRDDFNPAEIHYQVPEGPARLSVTWRV